MHLQDIPIFYLPATVDGLDSVLLRENRRYIVQRGFIATGLDISAGFERDVDDFGYVVGGHVGWFSGCVSGVVKVSRR